MKTWLFIICLLGFSCTISNKSCGEGLESCRKLDNILRIEGVRQMLKVQEINDPTFVRLVDLSGNFRDCGSFISRDGSSPLPYFVISKIPFDLNTGYYRDLIIYDVQELSNGLTKLTLICSIYKAESDVEPVNKITVFLDSENNVVDTGVSNYISKLPH